MNNQFFGDERDFYKYALLRALALNDLRIGVCWLLTQCEGKPDKNAHKYLCTKSKCLADTDEPLFRFLHHWVCRKQRWNIRLMENKFNGEYIIPHAKYFRGDFSQNDRARYFAKTTQRFADCDLVFFDPDIGMLPQNPEYKEDRYIQFDEIEECWRKIPGASFMIFQYYRCFCSDQSQKLHAQRWEKLKAIAPDAEVYAIWKYPVVYYFLMRKPHSTLLRKINTAARKCGFVAATPQP